MIVIVVITKILRKKKKKRKTAINLSNTVQLCKALHRGQPEARFSLRVGTRRGVTAAKMAPPMPSVSSPAHQPGSKTYFEEPWPCFFRIAMPMACRIPEASEDTSLWKEQGANDGPSSGEDLKASEVPDLRSFLFLANGQRLLRQVLDILEHLKTHTSRFGAKTSGLKLCGADCLSH